MSLNANFWQLQVGKSVVALRSCFWASPIKLFILPQIFCFPRPESANISFFSTGGSVWLQKKWDLHPELRKQRRCFYLLDNIVLPRTISAYLSYLGCLHDHKLVSFIWCLQTIFWALCARNCPLVCLEIRIK